MSGLIRIQLGGDSRQSGKVSLTSAKVPFAQCLLCVWLSLRRGHSRGRVVDSSFFFFLKIYLFIYDRHRERGRDTGGGEAGSMPGARRGTRSRDSRITPWAEGRHLTAEPPRDPINHCFKIAF